MSIKKTRLAAGAAIAGLAVAGVVALGSTAFADNTASPTTSPSASSTTQTTNGKADHQRGNGAMGQHTAATADETAKVKAAVEAKFSGVTVGTVQKDADGSFDADATKADGTKVRYEVSTDLATITESTGGPGGHGGKGGPGGASQDTPVTGDEKDKVVAAVQAKESGVTITEVRKDPDGSYDALGTKADGSKVFYDVSTDLATITANAGR